MKQQSTDNINKGKSKKVKGLILSAKILLYTFLAIVAFILSVNYNLFGLFGKIPSTELIMNPHSNNASQIYSEDGVMIGKFYYENRTPIKYRDINPVFWQALVSTEDERFYEHHGIDFYGVGAAFKDMIVHGHPRGASTITQQLAKNLYRVRSNYSTGLLGRVPGLRMLIIKTKEWISAVKLEMFYSKNEILNMYANTVEFGSNTYGIGTASKVYFNKTPKELRAEEAAVLVGILKATTFYNPVLNPENSHNRRNIVLDNMCNMDYISREECDSMKQLPLTLDYHPDEGNDNFAHYFRDAVANDIKEWCEVAGVDPYEDGLKIYTTLDSRMQKFAEESVQKNMRRVQADFNAHWGNTQPWSKEQPNLVNELVKKTSYYKELERIFPDNPDSVKYYINKPHQTKVFSYNGQVMKNLSLVDSINYMCRFMHCGFVAIDPNNGYVKAWVGDVDYKSWQYDKVTAERQPGSTFKLFVYTEAFNQGLTPLDRRTDSPVTIRVDENGGSRYWTPSNSNGSFSGDSMTLKNAFAQSINSVAVKLGQEVGVSSIAHTAHEMGITTKLNATPSLCLGASDVKLIDMARAYSAIANGGAKVTPILVTRIEDADGKVIYDAPVEKTQVLPKRTAGFMQQMLMGGVQNPNGTSHSLLNYIGNVSDTDFGGKTGTTNNNSDGWFMGVTHNLVCGAWVGGEYRSIHFRNGQGQGARTALPICADFLSRVFHSGAFGKYHGHFPPMSEEDMMFVDEPVDTLLVDSLIDDELLLDSFLMDDEML
ncbi:MAG: transglycosylase domain-containing protein [Prevotellaceae bacterium]|nr:transglycosylase domain-containing protein [Prevotellaceae bacterium]